MTGSKKEHMRIPNIGKIFTHGILSGILAVSASCSSRNDDPPTDAEGKRVVRTLEEYGADGRWGDRYHFFYTEDWELTRIENVQWYVMHDTLRQSRRIEIGEGSILVYEEDSPEPSAGATLENGLITGSFRQVGDRRYECSYHYLPDGRLDSISGSTICKLHWENGQVASYNRISASSWDITYLNEENKSNLNLSGLFWGLDENLYFYGFEKFCGLYSIRLVERSPGKDHTPDQSSFEYTKEGNDIPTRITESIAGEVYSHYSITYY